MATDGFGAPYINAYYKNIQITDRIESFKYSYSEDDDDDCEINIRLDDRNACDLPQYQEGAEWTIIWGFLNGKKSHVRKIFCYEVKPEFDDQNILITICFNEKALTMKQRSSKKIHTNTSIVDILHTSGKIHGVKTSVELDDGQGGTIKVATTDELMASLKAFYKKINDKNAEDIKLFGSTDDQVIQDAQEEAGVFNLDAQLANRAAMRDLVNGFTPYGSVAQGNKTDKQLIDELGKKQPGGQYILDTTDDEAVLRKRNFNQKPVRTFTWANGDGELQAFQPETKSKSKNGSSVNMNYDGWDPINKTYFNGDVDTLSDGVKNTLAKFQKQKEALANKADDFVLGSFTVRKEAGLKSDATNLVTILKTPYTVLDKKNAIQKTIDYFSDPDGHNKAINDPTIKNPRDAAANASNLRAEAELKNNPGYIEAWGDPTLTKGKIITVAGVSKKYSGNYYITKVEHMLDGSKPYMMHIDIVRQGHNIKTNKSMVDNKTSNKDLNKTIGPSGTLPKTRKPGITQNP